MPQNSMTSFMDGPLVLVQGWLAPDFLTFLILKKNTTLCYRRPEREGGKEIKLSEPHSVISMNYH